LHARNDRADEVDVENGKYVGKMENDGNCQEAKSWEPGHDGGLRNAPSVDCGGFRCGAGCDEIQDEFRETAIFGRVMV
jgi:hypothetical protein